MLSALAKGPGDMLLGPGAVLRAVRAAPLGVQEEGQQTQRLSEGRWGAR